MKALSTARLARAAAILWIVAGVPHAIAGYKEGMDALAVKDYARARGEFEQDRGNPQSVYALARMARMGLGEPIDDSRASSLLRMAAGMGHDPARLDYAYALGNGRGVDKDVRQAMQLLEELSGQGRSDAQVGLGRILRHGLWEQPKDEARAASLFHKAMESGDDNGRLQYASALINGVGVAKDEARGARLLQPMVDRGHLDAQLEYARLLTFGFGVTKDEAAGLAMYRKVVEANNHRVAQYAIGRAYLVGRGVPRDELVAARWIDASARQGWDWAQLELGDMFRRGVGVPQSRNEAYYWYSVAARGSAATVVSRANALRTGLARDMQEADLTRLVAKAEAFRAEPGLAARKTEYPPLAQGDSVDYGAVSLRVPLPEGYVNGWKMVDWMRRAYPNDPAQSSWIMVLHNQEDVNRIKLGLRSGMRRVEISRHFSDDTIRVSPTLFGELKTKLRSQIEAAVARGRYLYGGAIQDDETVFSILRSGVTDPNRIDALAYVLVREKVLVVAFNGFMREQERELPELVRRMGAGILEANSSAASDLASGR